MYCSLLILNFYDSFLILKGQIPEWPNGADCKSAGLRLRWFESIFAHKQSDNFGKNAEVAQLIEH